SSGFARLLFTFAPKSHVHASVDGGVLTLVFDRKTSVSATTIAQNAGSYAGGPRVDGDGRTYRFALVQPVRLHASESATQVAIDLLAPKIDADAYRPPGMAKPTVSAMTGKPAGISAEQDVAISGTARTLADANAPPAPPPEPVTITPMQTLEGVTPGYVP